MEGQQLPKATMNNFIKHHTTMLFSAEFVTRMLLLSRDFVDRLSNKANQICEKNNRKTINMDHLEAALVDFGLNNQIQNLKKLGNNIKEINQLKREESQRLEEAIQRQKKEEKERRLLEPTKKAVIVREKFEHIDASESHNNSDDFDYQSLYREFDEDLSQEEQK